MAERSLYELAQEAYGRSVRAVAYGDIANLFAAFTFYMRGNAEGDAFRELWSKRDDVKYVADGKGYAGREAVEAFMVKMREAQRQEKLSMLAALFPGEIKDSPEYLGAGDYDFHWLTTPNIRIADDLKTAKGAWWSPGIKAEVGPDGEMRSYLHTVNFGCDFINEDGQWKIWHLREFEEFSYPVAGSVVDMTGRQGQTRKELEKRLEAGAPKWNVEKTAMEPATKFRVARMLPDVVKPYDTWDDSMSCIRDY